MALLLVMSCQRHRGASNDPSNATQTIAPAVAQPAPTGTDQMTQTVNVEDSRSEEEGGTSSAPKKKTAPPPAKTQPKKKH